MTRTPSQQGRYKRRKGFDPLFGKQDCMIGIDPGLSGAIAVLGEMIFVWDMPTNTVSRNNKSKRELDTAVLMKMLVQAKVENPGIGATIEQATAMPKQGVSSVFSFGQSYGAVLGVLAGLGIPVTKVHPRVWKKAMRVNSGKDGSRARASELLPNCADMWERKKDDGRAEAALIALYGMGAEELS